MTRRADRRTGGFWTEDERPEGERYGKRRRDARWTPAQEAVLVAAVSACESEAAYRQVAHPLMVGLGHPPTFADDALPHPSVVADTALRAMELKLLTKMLGKDRGWRPHELIGFHRGGGPAAARDAPLTWGEKVKLLRPYHARLCGKKEVIDRHDLLMMMGRFSRPKAVYDYLDSLYGPRFKDPEDVAARPPIQVGSVEQLSDWVKSLDYCIALPQVGSGWRYRDNIKRLLGYPL